MYTPETITVYQAYPTAIALAAAKAGRFVPPFKRDRMTWLKPSFLWMMFRSQWADPQSQERVLAVEMTREGFEWALAHSCLAQYDHTFFPDREQWAATLSGSPVRVQWEHERSLELKALPWADPRPSCAIAPAVTERRHRRGRHRAGRRCAGFP